MTSSIPCVTVQTVTSNTLTADLTGIEEHNTIAVKVYPNPSAGSLTIETTMLSAGNIGLELRNILGQIVYSSNDKVQSGLFRKTLALDLTNGLYFLTLQTNHSYTTKKIEIVK
ncbi:MAG: T9SS type A sorting domain-containing protein [Sphingobacteriales bacterium JAD_PAG50586_3]|nr:MAG: T9SS type A sorting domain-containing protein [Sphingobacteriales bacterium JAD_PAG50586_3]